MYKKFFCLQRFADEITLTSGDDIYENNDSNKIIYGIGGNDSINNKGSQVTIDGGSDNDTIVSNNDGISIDGGEDADIISLTGGTLITINGGVGNDTIVVTDVTNSQIKGGGDNDIISISDITNNGENTIEGDEGNDTINSSVTSGIIYSYKKGDGNDVINGFGENDTLYVTDSGYPVSVSGNDLIVTAGDGKITLSGAASLSNPNITGSYAENAETFVQSLQYRTLLGYPVIAGLFFHPDEYHGFETLGSSFYVDSETLTINSADGLELTAYHYIPENPDDKWVILVHGYGHNHRHMNGFAQQYLTNNYHVLMVDQHAAGYSESEYSEGEWLTMGAATANACRRKS